jgi:SlyX protein
VRVEDRLHALEEKISYSDKDLAELNDVVYRQQQTIDKLLQQMKLITEQLRSLGIEVDPERHQKPPHW